MIKILFSPVFNSTEITFRANKPRKAVRKRPTERDGGREGWSWDLLEFPLMIRLKQPAKEKSKTGKSFSGVTPTIKTLPLTGTY